MAKQNIKRGLYNWSDGHQPQSGRKKKAEKAAERLKNEDFTDAYSSDLERTYETTNIIAEK